MRRFSILGLMGFVLAVAVAFAALRGANQYWAGGLLFALLGLLGYAVLASIHGQGRARAVWLGFLVIGGGYLLAVRTLPTLEAGWLPTSQLMEYVERQVIGANVITVNYTSNGLVTTTSLSPPPPTPAATAILATPGSPTVWSFANSTTTGTTNPTGTANFIRQWNPSGTVTATWAPILPGAADGDAFRSVGHSLFALVLGWIGAATARRTFERGSRQSANQATPAATESPNAL